MIALASTAVAFFLFGFIAAIVTVAFIMGEGDDMGIDGE